MILFMLTGTAAFWFWFGFPKLTLHIVAISSRGGVENGAEQTEECISVAIDNIPFDEYSGQIFY